MPAGRWYARGASSTRAGARLWLARPAHAHLARPARCGLPAGMGTGSPPRAHMHVSARVSAMAWHSRHSRPCGHATRVFSAFVVLVALACHATHTAAEVISGCTVDDVTRIVQSCDVATTVADFRFRDVRGFEAGAFPAGSQVTELCVLCCFVQPRAVCTCLSTT